MTALTSKQCCHDHLDGRSTLRYEVDTRAHYVAIICTACGHGLHAPVEWPKVETTPDPARPRMHVTHICTAYESGLGRGLSGRDLAQPYAAESDESTAYFEGWTLGRRRAAETAAPHTIPCGSESRPVVAPTSATERAADGTADLEAGNAHPPRIEYVRPMDLHAHTASCAETGCLQVRRASETTTPHAVTAECVEHDCPCQKDAPTSADAEDAEKWRALRTCARITAMGSAGIERETAADYAHVTLNFWTCTDNTYGGDPGPAWAREWLDKFVEKARRALKATPRQDCPHPNGCNQTPPCGEHCKEPF